MFIFCALLNYYAQNDISLLFIHPRAKSRSCFTKLIRLHIHKFILGKSHKCFTSFWQQERDTTVETLQLAQTFY